MPFARVPRQLAKKLSLSLSLSRNSPQKLPFVVLSRLFSTFMQNLPPFMHELGRFPALETALQIFGAENGPHLGAVEVVTALEALITKNDEVEGLTYRLGMRAVVPEILSRSAWEGKAWSKFK
jgi:hypothetical protein